MPGRGDYARAALVQRSCIDSDIIRRATPLSALYTHVGAGTGGTARAAPEQRFYVGSGITRRATPLADLYTHEPSS